MMSFPRRRAASVPGAGAAPGMLSEPEFSRLVDDTLDDAWRIALTCTGDRDRACDVVREAYAQVRGLEVCDTFASRRAWALAVVFDTARGYSPSFN